MSKEIKKLRELTKEELVQQMDQARKDLIDQRFQIVTGHITDVKKIKHLRKKIARINTIFTERSNG